MPSNLWGRITGKDKRQRVPNQQVSALGRLGDSTIVSPYGLYADLPANVLLKEIAPNVFIAVTEGRPEDTEQGEPVFFHPGTNTRIIARNNGDLDIISGEGGSVNIQTVSANVTASASVTIDTPETTITGNLTVQGDAALGSTVTSNGVNIGETHVHTQGVDSGGDVEQNTGGPQ